MCGNIVNDLLGMGAARQPWNQLRLAIPGQGLALGQLLHTLVPLFPNPSRCGCRRNFELPDALLLEMFAAPEVLLLL